MNKKLVIGGVVLLLVIGGGAFLLLAQTKTKPGLGESGPDTIPTQWSQAGDYKIEETAGGTVVTNSKAGFSFRVPVGWRVGSQVENSSTIESIGEGCSIFTSILYQSDEYDHLIGLIGRIKENLDFGQGVQSKQEVITISGHSSLRTSIFNSIEKENLTTLIVEIPFGSNGIINTELNFSEANRTQCLKRFEQALTTISIVLF